MDIKLLKKIYKYILLVVLVWFVLEFFYQLYLRCKWVKNGEYLWEYYVIKRNQDDLLNIQDYFQNYPKNYVYTFNDPSENSLDSLPKQIQNSILKLKNDLLCGIDIFKVRQQFILHFEKIDSMHYNIEIYAGATFKQDYNGYNFAANITNRDLLDGCKVPYTSNIYVYKEYLKEKKWKRPFPIVLKYNCNSYDLLILKLFR